MEEFILIKHLSTIKRARQNEKRRVRNAAVKSSIKTSLKKVTTAIESKDREAAEAALKKIIPMIDKAASKGTIHKKTASRKISRLTRKINSLT